MVDFKQINGISPLLLKYDYFIVDVWGVIHDGNDLYDGVLDTIKLIKKSNKKLCFLSNAPRRASRLAFQFKNLGIEEELYDFIVTSGEITFNFLKENQDRNFKDFGNEYFYIGPDRDSDLLEGLNYKKVDSVRNASFVFVTGFDNDNSTIDEKLPYIIEAKKQNLKMICANPDLKVVRKSGCEVICAGALAKYYSEELGGDVIYFGKPYYEAYELVLKKFFLEEKDKHKIIAVGDVIETDIAGANNAKIDSLLVLNGVYHGKFGLLESKNLNKQPLLKICKKYQSFPNYIIPNFKL